jgi:hypothetical protein
VKGLVLSYGSTVAWAGLAALGFAGSLLFSIETLIRGREAHRSRMDRVRRATEEAQLPVQRSAR